MSVDQLRNSRGTFSAARLAYSAVAVTATSKKRFSVKRSRYKNYTLWVPGMAIRNLNSADGAEGVDIFEVVLNFWVFCYYYNCNI